MAGIGDALFAGRAGIQAHGIGISVLSDNISNANSTAYKASRADFLDLVAGFGGGGRTVGSGSDVKRVTQIFNQGSFEFTGRNLDVAIDGEGFFVVQDSVGQQLYTRAGNLSVDSDGNVLDQNGNFILGFPTGGAGGLEGLNVNERTNNSVDTNQVTITGNLDASSDIIGAVPAVPGSSFADLNNAAAFSTFVDVFDSLGGSHTVTVYFFHTGSNQWQVNAYVDAGDVGGAVGDPALIGGVTMGFDATGQKNLPVALPDFTANATWSNGSNAGAIDFNLAPFSQFSSPSNIESINQDGTGGGSVVSFNIDNDGSLFAQLDNGQRAQVGTIALVNFSNKEGLRRLGTGLYADTNDSGEPVVGTPSVGRFGALVGGTLELSTSDISGDFIKLISFQRGFQGSARLITNVDDLLNEIINLA